jgi:hypothetical protein
MSDTTTYDDYDGASVEFDSPPEGSCMAVIAAHWDCGWQQTDYGTKRKIVLAYELDERDRRGKRYVVQTPYNKSIHPKSGLRVVVDAACGSLDKATVKRIKDVPGELSRLLVGKCVLASVKLNDKGRARIATVSSLPKQMHGIQVENVDLFTQPFGLATWYLDRKTDAPVPDKPKAETKTQEQASKLTEPNDDIPF